LDAFAAAPPSFERQPTDKTIDVEIKAAKSFDGIEQFLRYVECGMRISDCGLKKDESQASSHPPSF
jgi:hypothetical protein